MDLFTLVTGCASAVEPTIMPALIWYQSGGEPWSFAVPGERQPQLSRTVGDAVRATHATYPKDVTIRGGPTGLSATSRSVTTVFVSRPNVTVVARQIAQFGECLQTFHRFKGDLIRCAIAAYHSSWDRPDHAFARAARTAFTNHAPEFEMPDAARAMPLMSALQFSLPTPPLASDDRDQDWSSAIVRTESPPFDGSSIDSSARETDLQPSRKGLALRAHVRHQRRRTFHDIPFDVRTTHRPPPE
jgi:hypothetical protein